MDSLLVPNVNCEIGGGPYDNIHNCTKDLIHLLIFSGLFIFVVYFGKCLD